MGTYFEKYICQHNTNLKVCSKCHQPKEFTSYGKLKQGYDGLHPQCNQCRSEYYLKSKAKHCQKVKCSCGTEVDQKYLHKHQKTDKHFTLSQRNQSVIPMEPESLNIFC